VADLSFIYWAATATLRVNDGERKKKLTSRTKIEGIGYQLISRQERIAVGRFRQYARQGQ
jgi:hypothetical protein